MAWSTKEFDDHCTMHIGKFRLEAFQRQGKFDYDVVVECVDYNPDAIIASGDGDFETLEDAQGAALNALNEIIVEARAAIDHHLEREWKAETHQIALERSDCADQR
ncbi:MAG: hypothetical protein IPK52_00175 [Chloroflexi bacterium]|nr:hypothetical protein [Chloroflexota bacterium]